MNSNQTDSYIIGKSGLQPIHASVLCAVSLEPELDTQWWMEVGEVVCCDWVAMVLCHLQHKPFTCAQRRVVQGGGRLTPFKIMLCDKGVSVCRGWEYISREISFRSLLFSESSSIQTNKQKHRQEYIDSNDNSQPNQNNSNNSHISNIKHAIQILHY